MAKCKLLSKETGQCMATRAQWNKCKQDTCPMDKYTTENCNMKRKPKYKKIKAVAAINREGEMYSIRHEIDSEKWDKRVWKPCTILINAKYLKGEK